MNKDALHSLLVDQKDELNHRIEKIEKDLKSRHFSKKPSQQNVERANDDVLAALKFEAQQKLDLTKKAIYRLGNEQFGHCMKCGSRIDDKRLETLPHTEHCSLCARKELGIHQRHAADTSTISNA